MYLNAFFDGFANFMNSGFMQWVINLFSFIPRIVYFLLACVSCLIDVFQVLFRKLAGLDVIIIDGELVKGDPVFTIISKAIFQGKGNYNALSTTFWSLIILGVIMVFITTFIAVVRVEMVPDKESKNNSKEGIVRNFFKALFNLAIVPISCIFALYAGNAMVRGLPTHIVRREHVAQICREKDYRRIRPGRLRCAEFRRRSVLPDQYFGEEPPRWADGGAHRNR